MAAEKTIYILHRIRTKGKNDNTYFVCIFKCIICNLNHSLQDCVQFRQLDIGQR